MQANVSRNTISAMEKEMIQKKLLTVLLFSLSLLISNANAQTQPVKMSKTGICHAPGTRYYAQTKNYTPYKSMDDCLKAGGRKPK